MTRALKLLVIVTLGFFCITVGAEEVPAEKKVASENVLSKKKAEDGVEVGLSFDFYSQYIWRGQQLTDGWVFQPSVTAKKGGLSGTVWGNLDMSNVNDSKNEFTEADYSLDYSGRLSELIGYSAGVIYYDFPNTTLKSTTEIYGGLNFALPLNPTITVYQDVDEVDGTYVSLGAGHSFGKIIKLSEDIQVGMDVGASVGWGNSSYNDAYWSVDESAVNDLLLSLTFPVELPGGWGLAGSVNYSSILSEKIREAHGGDEDHVFTGISLAKSF